MPAVRGRTLSTFGQAFSPWGVSGGQGVVPPPTPTPVVVSSGAGNYPSDYRLTQRLTRLQWLHLLYGPQGPTIEQLSDQRLFEFLEDDDLTALLIL